MAIAIGSGNIWNVKFCGNVCFPVFLQFGLIGDILAGSLKFTVHCHSQTLSVILKLPRIHSLFVFSAALQAASECPQRQ